MPKQTAVIQTRIDPQIKEKASQVLSLVGLSVSDAMRMFITRTANQGSLPLELFADNQQYDTWFASKVKEALSDKGEQKPHHEVTSQFSAKRKSIIKKS